MAGEEMRRAVTAICLSVVGAVTCTALIAESAGAHTKRFKTNVNVVWGPVISYPSDADDPYGGVYVEGASGTVGSKLALCRKNRYVTIRRVPEQHDINEAEDTTDASGNFVLRIYPFNTGPPPFYSGWPHVAIVEKKVIGRRGHRHICKPTVLHLTTP